MLEPANKQEQSRNRFLTCNQEIQRRGKVRLIQHIRGENTTHVKPCPSPITPLKENLMKRQQSSDKIRLNSRSRERAIKEEGEGECEIADEEYTQEPAALKSSVAACPTSSTRRSVKKSVKPRTKKRLNPSSQSPSYPSKKPSEPLTDYEVCNQHFLSLIRRMYEVVPEIVEHVIMLESMEDTTVTTEESSVSPPTPSDIPWVSNLLSSVHATPAPSSLQNLSFGDAITFPLPSSTI